MFYRSAFIYAVCLIILVLDIVLSAHSQIIFRDDFELSSSLEGLESRGYVSPIRDNAPIIVGPYFDRASGVSIQDWNGGTNTYNRHQGTDFNVQRTGCGHSRGDGWCDLGVEVRAAASGRVLFVAEDFEDFDPPCDFETLGFSACNDFGNQVRIIHGDDTVTQYAHLQRRSVTVDVGDSVVCGQVIGRIGMSGATTSPHLHFGVLSGGGKWIDPFDAGSASLWKQQGNYGGVPSNNCNATPDSTPPIVESEVWQREISESAEIDSFIFDAVAGERFVLSVVDTSTNVSLRPAARLYRPDGSLMIADETFSDGIVTFDCFDRTDDQGCDIEQTGQYRLLVSDNNFGNDTGPYEVRLTRE